MQDTIAKLNTLLGQNEPYEAKKLANLMAQTYLQFKEDEVKSLIPGLSKTIDSLSQLAKNKRSEIVFGFFCHPQILRIQIELMGGMPDLYKATHAKCIKFILESGKQIYDGRAPDDTEDGHMTKSQITSQIQQNMRANVPKPPPVPAPAPAQAQPEVPPPPYPIGSFTVAIPK
jgi:hypothetical protein